MLPPNLDATGEINTPGACMLQFARVEDVQTFPAEVRGTLATAIVLRDGAQWTTVHPTRWTQEFTEDWAMADGDQYSRAKLAFELPKDRPELLDGLWRLKPGRYVVLHHDRNGTVRVLGTKDEPAMLRVQQLGHGGDPSRSGNKYLAAVHVSRRTACPFYLESAPQAYTCQPALVRYQGADGEPGEPIEVASGASLLVPRMAIRNSADDSTLEYSAAGAPTHVLRQVRLYLTLADGSVDEALADIASLVLGAYEFADVASQAFPLPRFTVFATDGSTPLTYRDLTDPTFTVPPVRLHITGADGNVYTDEQPVTELDSGALNLTDRATAVVPIPRFTVRAPDGTPIAYRDIGTPEFQIECDLELEGWLKVSGSGTAEYDGLYHAIDDADAWSVLLSVKVGGSQIYQKGDPGSGYVVFNYADYGGSGNRWLILKEGAGENYKASSTADSSPIGLAYEPDSGTVDEPGPTVAQATLRDLCACDCEGEGECGPHVVKVEGLVVLRKEEPCDAEDDLAFDGLVEAAVAEGTGTNGEIGLYPPGTDVNGKHAYYFNGWYIYYNGTEWAADDGFNLHSAATGNEDEPWDADWSGTSGAFEVRQALLSDLAPPATVNTTDGGTPVVTVGAGASANLQQSVIKYKDASNSDDAAGPYDTEFDATNLHPDIVVGRASLKDASSNHLAWVDLAQLANNTLPPAPSATVKTTDGGTTVKTVLAGDTDTLQQSVIKYKDAANASQVTSAADTEYASGTLRSATEVPRREIKYANGTGTGEYATVARLIADTLPGVPNVVKDLFLRFSFAAGDDTSLTHTVDSDSAGTYTAIAQDGSSGTLTVSINGGAFAAFSNPTALVATNTIAVKRTTFSGAGYIKLTGTYT